MYPFDISKAFWHLATLRTATTTVYAGYMGNITVHPPQLVWCWVGKNFYKFLLLGAFALDVWFASFGGPQNWIKKFFNAAIWGDCQQWDTWCWLKERPVPATFLRHFKVMWMQDAQKWLSLWWHRFHMVALLWSIATASAVSSAGSWVCPAVAQSAYSRNCLDDEGWWMKKCTLVRVSGVTLLTLWEHFESQSLWESLWWGFLG